MEHAGYITDRQDRCLPTDHTTDHTALICEYFILNPSLLNLSPCLPSHHHHRQKIIEWSDIETSFIDRRLAEKSSMIIIQWQVSILAIDLGSRYNMYPMYLHASRTIFLDLLRHNGCLISAVLFLRTVPGLCGCVCISVCGYIQRGGIFWISSDVSTIHVTMSRYSPESINTRNDNRKLIWCRL